MFGFCGSVVLLAIFSSGTAKGFSIFENDIIQRIFRQDADFCFQPFPSTGCSNGSLWNNFASDATNGTEMPEPKTMAFLFTPTNRRRPEFLHRCGGGTLPDNTNFNSRYRTEVFIHGFLDGVCRSAWMREVKNELFKRGFYNVILIDWSWGNGPNYTESAANTKVVAEQVAILIENTMNASGVGPENFHIVGHSLGAHVAGLVGQRVKNLRRITALDPALAPFQNKSKNERLDSSDANLVDIIHTNGGSVPGEVLGDINPLGHVDFYPNGGTIQDSCRGHIVKSYLSLDFLYATISLVPRICSHMQAVQYYKASINPKGCEFVGVECLDFESFNSGRCSPTCRPDGASNCAVMGMNHEFYSSNRTVADSESRRFFLNTTIPYPHCDVSRINVENFKKMTLDKEKAEFF